MKTFIYYSPSNKEIIAIVAKTSQEAAVKVVHTISNKIIRDDYYLATSVNHVQGSIEAVDLDMFDSLKDESELNALENESIER